MMKQALKGFLKKTGLYYFLQGRYRYALQAFQIRLNKTRYAKYKGAGYSCNICGVSYSRFVPSRPDAAIEPAIRINQVIGGFGENIYCPACGSTARQRLVVAALSRFDLQHKSVLHLSPEKPVFDFLKQKAIVTTADIEPGFYTIVDPDVVFADATQLPFENETFDWLIANHVLEHIPDDRLAMREFYRVLKKGGQAILQVPYSEILSATIEQPHLSDAPMQEKLFGQKDHVRIYQLNDYMQRLRETGFIVSAVTSDEISAAPFAFQPEERLILVDKK